jgi:hypothetical protein
MELEDQVKVHLYGSGNKEIAIMFHIKRGNRKDLLPLSVSATLLKKFQPHSIPNLSLLLR